VSLSSNVRSLVAALFISGSASSCGPPNTYVWVQDLPEQARAAPEDLYRVDAGDLLDIKVYNEERFSTKTRVRADGRITFSMIGDVEVRGRTPGEVAKLLGQGLQRVLNAPIITVAVEEARPISISVVGEAASPGIYNIQARSGVLQAIAQAGGLTEFADYDQIYVVRKSPPQRIRFSYYGLTNNDTAAASFVLQNGDVISVE
jgi:polysaccharide export outer membrane protein